MKTSLMMGHFLILERGISEFKSGKFKEERDNFYSLPFSVVFSRKLPFYPRIWSSPYIIS
jgi:hypothetical protein